MTGEALVRKLEQRDVLSDDERRAVANAVSRIKSFRADEDIVPDGSRPSESNLLIEGFACRSKTMADGRRQITALHVPGDFVDLHSFLLKTMDHAVVALTSCKVALVPHDTLRTITERHPHLARMLWLATLIDASIHREWMTGMGRRTALGQVAHLVCELFLRLQVVGLTEGSSFRLPITQQELGDMLGLSGVHINRVLMELRGQSLITWRGDTVSVDDWEGLKQAAEFDPTYLHLQQEPR
jgi:CRP-like cAMP-binding protein